FTSSRGLRGSASYTDFGVPGAILASDRKPWSEAEAARQIALVRAAWTVFNRVAALTPADLRKGPRGGGRDRDKVIDHVLGAEVAYARKLGVKHRQPARDDTEAIMAIRDTWPAGAYDPAAAGGRVNAPPGTLGIHEGMEVESSDGHRVGTVDALDIDLATGDIQG